MSSPLPHDVELMEGASALPRDNGELVFAAPWEGRALALAVALVDRLDLPWDAFRQHLIASIAEAPDRPYYESWTAALEALVVDLELATPSALDAATPTERAPSEATRRTIVADGEGTVIERRMVDPAGDAWARWASALGALSERLTGADFPTDARGRAEGIRHLARQAGLALQGELEHADSRHPRLHRYELPWSQWGAPNPDNVYERCAIDPRAVYVLRGRVDGVHEALFSLVEGDMHLDENQVYAEVALTDLVVGDGSFELTIGPDDHAGNHLRSEPGVRLLLIRQYVYDWNHDAVAHFTIERTDTAGTSAPSPTPDDVAAALDRATRWVERSIDYWAAYVAASRDLLEHNTFTAPNTPPGGAPSIAYGGGCFELGPDEALLIEHDEPRARYWNWSIHNLYWFDSGAWDQRLMSCNGHQAHVDDDGRVRLVVAHTDPGVPNWLDTESRPIGMAVYRYVGASTKPRPTARVVSMRDLRAWLPDAHPVVDAQARRRQLAERSRAAQRRWS